jgi:hypothetical protein
VRYIRKVIERSGRNVEQDVQAVGAQYNISLATLAARTGDRLIVLHFALRLNLHFTLHCALHFVLALRIRHNLRNLKIDKSQAKIHRFTKNIQSERCLATKSRNPSEVLFTLSVVCAGRKKCGSAWSATWIAKGKSALIAAGSKAGQARD